MKDPIDLSKFPPKSQYKNSCKDIFFSYSPNNQNFQQGYLGIQQTKITGTLHIRRPITNPLLTDYLPASLLFKRPTKAKISYTLKAKISLRPTLLPIPMIRTSMPTLKGVEYEVNLDQTIFGIGNSSVHSDHIVICHKVKVKIILKDAPEIKFEKEVKIVNTLCEEDASAITEERRRSNWSKMDKLSAKAVFNLLIN